MYYHVFNRSIAKFRIFNSAEEFGRMQEVISYYRKAKRVVNFSKIWKSASSGGATHSRDDLFVENGKEPIDIIAYCLMPTHIHLILKQISERGISSFTNAILNSYTRYFNIKHGRKGPLWEGRSKRVPIETDEQLLHLTRYVHLNPVSAYLVDEPEDWEFSSFSEYTSKAQMENRICDYRGLIDMGPMEYKKFVKDGISYQRELEKIKHLTFD